MSPQDELRADPALRLLLETPRNSQGFVVLHAAPARFRAGMVVCADGTDWDPGYGAGLYLRNEANDEWIPLIHRPTSATAVSASGTSVDFTSIPSWAKRVTVSFSGLSTSGASLAILQIGDSGGVETTGYIGSVSGSANAVSPAAANFSSGFALTTSNAAASVMSGTVVLTLIGSNTWAASVAVGFSNVVFAISGAGSKALSGTLDRVRITTAGGVDTFDAGTVNVLYE